MAASAGHSACKRSRFQSGSAGNVTSAGQPGIALAVLRLPPAGDQSRAAEARNPERFVMKARFEAPSTRFPGRCPDENLGSPTTAAIHDTAGGAKMDWTMKYQDRIVRDPQIVGGEPILKGTRVTLKTVLASLAEGATTNEILADFPTLSEEDVWAAIAFAAGSAQEDMPLIETPIKR